MIIFRSFIALPLCFGCFLLLAGCGEQTQAQPDEIDVSSLIEQGAYTEALAQLNEVLIEHPRDPNLLYNLALVKQKMNELEEARLTLEKAGAYSPDDDSIKLALAEITLEQGDEQIAWDYFVSLGQSAKQTARGQLVKGLILSRMNDYQQAEPALRAALEMGQNSAGTYAALAFVSAQQGQMDQAREFINQAMQSDDLSPDTKLQIGESYLASGDAKAAQNTAQQLKKELPEDARVYTLLGKAEMILLNFGEAESAFTRALSCPNSTVWTRIHYAMMLFAAEREDEAFTQAKDAENQLDLSGQTIQDPVLFNLLATLYARRSQSLLAHSYLTRSLAIDPDQAKVKELLNRIKVE